MGKSSVCYMVCSGEDGMYIIRKKSLNLSILEWPALSVLFLLLSCLIRVGRVLSRLKLQLFWHCSESRGQCLHLENKNRGNTSLRLHVHHTEAFAHPLAITEESSIQSLSAHHAVIFSCPVLLDHLIEKILLACPRRSLET